VWRMRLKSGNCINSDLCGNVLVAFKVAPPRRFKRPRNPPLTSPALHLPLSIDPAKDADIRALLELIGTRDQFQESINLIADQYREKLLASVPNNAKGQAFINNVISGYEKNFDVDQVTEQMVAAYDKHYTDDEIKGLLQFYGSPLGPKGKRPKAEKSPVKSRKPRVPRLSRPSRTLCKQPRSRIPSPDRMPGCTFLRSAAGSHSIAPSRKRPQQAAQQSQP